MTPLASALAIPTSLTSSPTRQRKRAAPARRPRAPTRCGTADVSEESESSSAPIKRSVVVMCHGVTPHARAGLFSAANLLQGRVDVWCRCVTAGLYLSDDVRRDTVVHLVMQSDDLASCRLVSVDGARVEGLAPAEKNVALLLQRAMQHASLDQLPTLARDAPGGRRSRGGDGTASEAGDGDEVREKSARNARKRVGEWLAKRPGSAGPVPGIAVSDHQSLEACLRDALRGCGAVALLDVDGDDASCVLARPLDNPENGEGFAVVVGDGSGITPDERRTLMFVFGAVLMAMGGKTLLASHCVVLAHAALDGEEARRRRMGRTPTSS